MDKRWIKIGKAIGIGLVFGLVAYMISGDGNTSTLLAMLIIYLENKI
jgi:hypothetical protein